MSVSKHTRESRAKEDERSEMMTLIPRRVVHRSPHVLQIVCVACRQNRTYIYLLSASYHVKTTIRYPTRLPRPKHTSLHALRLTKDVSRPQTLGCSNNITYIISSAGFSRVSVVGTTGESAKYNLPLLRPRFSPISS